MKKKLIILAMISVSTISCCNMNRDCGCLLKAKEEKEIEEEKKK